MFLAILPFSILSGCVTDDSSGADSPSGTERAAGDMQAYTPINRKGSLSLQPPQHPLSEPSRSCQLINAGTPYRVLNLNASISWDPASDRTSHLRLTLIAGAAGQDVAVEGPTPLSLEATPFNVSAGETFGLVLSPVGQETTDFFMMPPQEIRFSAHFVAQREVDQAGRHLGRWTTDCPA